jgi:hypothetical protein
MKSKPQTDAEIFSSATQADNDISQINVRNTDSVHPNDCICTLCKNVRKNRSKGISVPERIEKTKLDWYGEDTA